MREKHFNVLRRHMVELIEIMTEVSAPEIGKEALDARVLEVMGRVPRHLFVPAELMAHAYENAPLPIGFGKTISQPFMVAMMTDLLGVEPDSVVLEVGTGLGYQTAILAELAKKVWSIEIVEELAAAAQERLATEGYDNIEIRIGDGSRGWPEHAPFDRILVSAGAKTLPPALTEQLAPGGRMVLPTGPPEAQQLTVVDKDADGELEMRGLMAVRFTELEVI